MRRTLPTLLANRCSSSASVHRPPTAVSRNGLLQPSSVPSSASSIDISRPFVDTALTRPYTRADFKGFLSDYEIHTTSVIGSTDRSPFIQELIRKVLLHHLPPVAHLLTPDKLAFIWQRIYHVRRLKIPGKFDVAVCVREIRPFESRILSAIFETDQESASLVSAVDVACLDGSTGVIEIPRDVKRAFMVLGGGEETLKEKRVFRFGL